MLVHWVDVFAERSFQGNPLAVVMADDVPLDTNAMQAIAQEFNLSETTFVIGLSDGRAQVRIFTPSTELPFAGHPVLGTAWVLLQRILKGARNQITLQLAAGDVAVELEEESGVLWLQSPSPLLQEGLNPTTAAELLNLSEQDLLSTEYPIQRADIGPCFQIIAVSDRQALARCRVNAAAYEAYLADKQTVDGLFVFTTDSHSADADFAARMFFSADGVREDPATGSANCCFAAYLQSLYNGPFTAQVDQGVEMGRASRIHIEVGDDNIRVGGRVQPVFQGTLTTLPDHGKPVTGE